MKSRKGFVSNSSTTSVVIVGASLDSSEFKDILVKEFFMTQEFLDDSYHDLSLEEMKEDFGSVNTYELKDFLDNKSELDFYTGYDSEPIYVGINPTPKSGYKNDKSFMERLKDSHDRVMNIAETVNNCKFFTEEGKKKILESIDWHEEAYRDG